MPKLPYAIAILLASFWSCSGPAPMRSALSLAPRNADVPVHDLVEYGPEQLADPTTWQPGSTPLDFPAMGGVLESRAARAPRPFRSVLPSWNADVPSGAGLAVELQVRGDDWDWSPWLYLGDWGEQADTTLRSTRFDHGQVAVDVLHLDRPATWFRWRVRGLGGPGQLRIQRFALAFEGTTPLATHDPSDDSGKPLDLDLPIRSQQVEAPGLAERICSPTSVAMAVEHFGVNRTTADVAALLYDATHDIYGNWNRAVQGAYELGVEGRLERLSSWVQVRERLWRGEVLVIRVAAEPGELANAPYASTDGHLLAIRGLDGAGGVLCHDPAGANPDQVERTYSCEDLERVWLRKGGVTYVFTGPREG